MLRLRIAIFAALLLALLGVAVSTTRHAPALTARVVQVAKLGDKHFNVSVVVSNRTHHAYLLFIPSLEIRDGDGWKSLPETLAAYTSDDTLSGYGSRTQLVAFTKFQSGSRLRLLIEGEKRSKSNVEGFLFRLQLRLFGGGPLPPVNQPMHADAVATTEEFTEP